MKFLGVLILGLCGCGHRDVLLMDTSGVNTNVTIEDLQEQNWKEAVKEGLVSTNNSHLTIQERHHLVVQAMAEWCLTNTLLNP